MKTAGRIADRRERGNRAHAVDVSAHEVAAEAVRASLTKLGVAQAAFDWRRGPRNQPALDWLAGFADEAIEGEAGRVAAPPAKLQAAPSAAVSVRWIDG